MCCLHRLHTRLKTSATGQSSDGGGDSSSSSAASLPAPRVRGAQWTRSKQDLLLTQTLRQGGLGAATYVSELGQAPCTRAPSVTDTTKGRLAFTTWAPENMQSCQPPNAAQVQVLQHAVMNQAQRLAHSYGRPTRHSTQRSRVGFWSAAAQAQNRARQDRPAGCSTHRV